jgi:hypothetical protein
LNYFRWWRWTLTIDTKELSTHDFLEALKAKAMLMGFPSFKQQLSESQVFRISAILMQIFRVELSIEDVAKVLALYPSARREMAVLEGDDFRDYVVKIAHDFQEKNPIEQQNFRGIKQRKQYFSRR